MLPHPPMTSAPSISDPRLAYFSALPTSTKLPSSEPTNTSPTLSSSSTSSSSSLSPSSSTMASSSVLSRRPQGSSESIGTTASPGSFREGERRESGGSSAQMGMEGLTVMDESAGGTKTRRASMLSCGSGKAAEGEGGKGGRRKAARVGSFEAHLNGQERGFAQDDDEGDGAVTDDEAAAEGDAGSELEPTPSAAPFASNPRPPIPIDTGTSIDQTAFSQLPTPPLPTQPAAPTPHVDIVSYPSADLLRLLASLLEQIAQANDALNQRTASGSNTPGLQRSSSNAGPGVEEGEESPFERSRFDAAPLNSPATPRLRRGVSNSSGPYGEDGMDEDDLPFTPGIDLQREVGAGGGVEGFMPSLGGAHAPMPLARRRGSSFLTKREREKQAGASTALGQKGVADTLPGSLASTSMSTSTSSGTSTPAMNEPPLSSLLTASSLALASPSATLCFHARNVPAISIEAYLLRILKYCPTTNEVFLSLLVYFDRMARVGLEAQRVGLVGSEASSGVRRAEGDGPPRLFAIDSFNVHRLVIAGVTVASKFFSDVFYTNSRYAKVGGLPLNELNQLELQFLLLNDFRLVIPVDELQRYADQLILFWVGRNPPPTPTVSPPLPASTVEPQEESRPTSVRSQPSSSGTSVTSTITPGTPSTPRASDDGRTESEGEESDVPMEED